jgi:hypothetical protein
MTGAREAMRQWALIRAMKADREERSRRRKGE